MIHIKNKDEIINFHKFLNKEHYNILIRITSPSLSFRKLEDFSYYKDILEIKFEDDDNSFNDNHLQEIINFYFKHLNCHNLIVHCDRGLNRSASVALGFLILKEEKRNFYKLIEDNKRIYPNRYILEKFIDKFDFDINIDNLYEKLKNRIT